jgi:hypothetical protein
MKDTYIFIGAERLQYYSHRSVVVVTAVVAVVAVVVCRVRHRWGVHRNRSVLMRAEW